MCFYKIYHFVQSQRTMHAPPAYSPPHVPMHTSEGPSCWDQQFWQSASLNMGAVTQSRSRDESSVKIKEKKKEEFILKAYMHSFCDCQNVQILQIIHILNIIMDIPYIPIYIHVGITNHYRPEPLFPILILQQSIYIHACINKTL